MEVADGGGGATIPPGNPGSIAGAAGQLSGLATQIDSARAQSQGASGHLVGTSWDSPAASIFQQASGTYANDLLTLSSAVTSAAGALKAYAAALESAQNEAKAALAAQTQAQSTADDAQGRVAGTTPPAGASPSAVSAFNAQQSKALTAIDDTLSQAVTAAGNRLSDAFTRAQAAATACGGALTSAAGRMAALAAKEPSGGAGAPGVAAKGGWEDLFKGWFENSSHINDFLGGAATSLVKQFDQAAKDYGATVLKEFENLPQDEDGVLAVLAGDATAGGLLKADDGFTSLLSATARANNPLVKLLTKGLSGDEDSALEKVPVLGALFTLGAIGLNLSDGKGIVPSIGVPVTNLVIGTATAEGVSTFLASDAAASLLGGVAIPGVGEVIICGAAAVLVGYGVDKGATYLWDHRAAVEHDVGTAVTTLIHVDATELHYGAVALSAIKNEVSSATNWAISGGEHIVSTGAGFVWHGVEGLGSGLASGGSWALGELGL